MLHEFAIQTGLFAIVLLFKSLLNIRQDLWLDNVVDQCLYNLLNYTILSSKCLC